MLGQSKAILTGQINHTALNKVAFKCNLWVIMAIKVKCSLSIILEILIEMREETQGKDFKKYLIWNLLWIIQSLICKAKKIVS